MNLNKLSDFVVPITYTFSVHLQHTMYCHLPPNVNMLYIQILSRVVCGDKLW